MDKTGKRADGTLVVNILNPKDSFGRFIFYNGESRLRKEVDRYTTTCEECEGIGRYDDRGEVVCVDCGLVLSGSDEDHSYDPPVYADKYSGQGGSNDASHGNRGASGHPLMRVPSLNEPGPSGEESAAGHS